MVTFVKGKKKKANDRKRAWSITWNNPDQPLNADAVSYGDYLVYQLEQGIEKTPHYQGLVYWKNAKSMSATMKALGIPLGAEVQPSNNLERCIFYSRKTTGYWYKGEVYDEIPKGAKKEDVHWSEQLEEPLEFGLPPKGQGKRTDMEEIKQLLDNGQCLEGIENQYFNTFARYRKFFLDYRNRKTPKRQKKAEIKILFGKSGTGKSRWASDKYPNAYHLHCSNGGGNIWFDGY